MCLCLFFELLLGSRCVRHQFTGGSWPYPHTRDNPCSSSMILSSHHHLRLLSPVLTLLLVLMCHKTWLPFISFSVTHTFSPSFSLSVTLSFSIVLCSSLVFSIIRWVTPFLLLSFPFFLYWKRRTKRESCHRTLLQCVCRVILKGILCFPFEY